MNGPTKILTVSYGTFSCTLEGFDDPLGSMREMAEYFRDLAADDRYFGAEPPTPDVEMLQRIAEKEVQRRVEARVTDAGVALVAAAPSAAPSPPPESVSEADAEPAALEPEPAGEGDTGATASLEARGATSTPLVSETGPLAYDDDYLMPDEPENVLPVDTSAEVDISQPAETVAEKLRRIRAVVSQNIERDTSALMREQTPNADDPDLRDRALSRTIQQIQADIAEDHASDDVAPDVMEAQDAFAMASDPVETPDGDISTEVQADDEWSAETDLEAPSNEVEIEEESAPSPRPDRTVSEMIGSVSERLAEDVPPEEDTKPSSPNRALSQELDADMGRLLNETDNKLNDNETVRRRRVISQMRAAVAATKADRLVSHTVSKEEQEEAEQNPYREDLSEAVQSEPAEETTRASSAPPLVLVSSQRIDSEQPEDDGNAAAFAAQVGAKDLPELMEAAAAFTIFSEGQPSFTRPEIMQMVTSMDPSLELSREESLRSFGQLLRDGKFKKLERGQFTIDADTKYNPQQFAAQL
ncbi:MAG: hypothetical protein AAF718_01325 [Pseudomonadota bacterium]